MQSDAVHNLGGEAPGRRAAKRQRVSRACAPCRYAKLRCDGQQPICTTCRQQSKRCTFEVPSKRRGLRPGYVRVLELLWAKTFRELENAESIVDELLGHLSRQDLIASSDRSDSTTPASLLLDQWKQSIVARRIDDLLNDDNDEQEVDGEDLRAQDELQQLRSDGKPYWIVAKNEISQTLPTQPERGLPDFNLNPIFLDAEDFLIHSAGSSLQPPPYASRLLQLFLKCEQAWLPIFQRHVMLKTTFQFSTGSSSLNSGDRSALWAVYAYASTALGHLLTDETSRQHAHLHSNEYYAQAYSMLPLDSNQPIELGHVQCILVLALTRLSSGASTAAWRLIRIATLLLKEMGAQQESAGEHDVVARAWLVCFVLDTISSVCRQSVPSLHYNDVTGYLHVDENGAEEWQPWQRPRTTQNQNTLEEPHKDVPTHSVGLLVLQVKLLRFLNENLHLRNTSWQLTGTQVEEWNQDFSNYLTRTGLTTVLRDGDFNLLALPPSFVVLGIIYTALVNRVDAVSSLSAHVNDPTVERMDYPLLSDTSLQILRREDNFYKNNAITQLLLSKLDVRDGEPASSIVLDAGGRLLDLDSGLDYRIPIPGLQGFGAEASDPIDQGAFQLAQGVQENQENSIQFSTTSIPNVGPGEDLMNLQGPGSISSIDSYVFPTDAPFFQFIDGLDDRTILDTDLFGRSLGFKF